MIAQLDDQWTHGIDKAFCLGTNENASPNASAARRA